MAAPYATSDDSRSLGPPEVGRIQQERAGPVGDEQQRLGHSASVTHAVDRLGDQRSDLGVAHTHSGVDGVLECEALPGVAMDAVAEKALQPHIGA